MPVISVPSIEAVRAKFPALNDSFALMDNAGGSQVPTSVIEAVRDFMLNDYVQVGGSYAASMRATQVIADAHAMVNTMFGGEGIGKVIFGASTSSLCRMLSDCYAEVLGPGDEVIVAENGHEANVNPWVVLGNRGISVKIWQCDPDTGENHLEDLRALISDRTRIVAFPHVSNILGSIEDIEPIVQLAHSVGARVVLDSVAYAPHRALDVARWGVDYCVFSCYKVFGPHVGALWGSNEALSEITGRNHPFISKEEIPSKFELGGSPPEGCAGLLGIRPYFAFLAGAGAGQFDRNTVVEAFAAAQALEDPLTQKILASLNGKKAVRIIGPTTTKDRVGTISILHSKMTPADLVAHTDKVGIGLRHGNFYSVRLMERMGIPWRQGVARISLVHYNSPDEIDRLIAALDPIL